MAHEQAVVSYPPSPLGDTPKPAATERIAVGFVNFPGPDWEEYDEPEVQPYLAVLEGLKERLVPFTNSKGVTLELFVEVAAVAPLGDTPALIPGEAYRHANFVCGRCGCADLMAGDTPDQQEQKR